MKQSLILGTIGLFIGIGSMAQPVLINKLDRFTHTLNSKKEIADDRKEMLSDIGETLMRNKLENGSASVVFLDETNSSKSQLAQALFQMALIKHNVSGINVISAGIKETSVDKEVISYLKNAGFNIEVNSTFKNNSRYMAMYSWDENK